MNDNHIKIDTLYKKVKHLMETSETEAMRWKWKYVYGKLYGALQELSDLLQFANEQAELHKTNKIRATIEIK